MKALLAKVSLIALLVVSFNITADVKSDMEDPSLSLVAVMQNAINDGMSVASAVKAMIALDPEMSNSIVATAMVIAPDQYRAVVNAAIEAGASAGQVVAAALIATDGENADNIIAAAVDAAPSERQAIIDASVRALPSTTAGIQAVAASPLRATVVRGTGGGASVTAEEANALQATLDQIAADLAAAGFAADEVATAVSDITVALEESEADVETATDALVQLQADLEAAQAAQEAIPELEAEVETLTAESNAAEDEVDTAIAEASVVVAQANTAEADVDRLESQKAEVEAGVTEVEELESLASSDPDTFVAEADSRLAEAEAELATLGTEEDAQAALDDAVAAYEAVAEEDAALDLEIQKIEAAIAELEGSAQGIAEILAGAVTGSDLGSLQAQLTTLQNQRNSLNASGLQQTANALSATLGQIIRLTGVVNFLEASAASIEEGNAPGSAVWLNDVAVPLADLSAEDTQLGLDLVTAVAFQDTTTAEAQATLGTLTAQIDNLVTIASDLVDKTDELNDAETAADLDKIAEDINDTINSVVTTT